MLKLKEFLLNNKSENNANNFNKDSYENEIRDLKEKLNKANKIIEKQKIEIQDLKNQLNSFKNIDMNKINNLQNEFN